MPFCTGCFNKLVSAKSEDPGKVKCLRCDTINAKPPASSPVKTTIGSEYNEDHKGWEVNSRRFETTYEIDQEEDSSCVDYDAFDHPPNCDYPDFHACDPAYDDTDCARCEARFAHFKYTGAVNGEVGNWTLCVGCHETKKNWTYDVDKVQELQDRYPEVDVVVAKSILRKGGPHPEPDGQVIDVAPIPNDDQGFPMECTVNGPRRKWLPYNQYAKIKKQGQQ
jgi:hypothetical protein